MIATAVEMPVVEAAGEVESQRTPTSEAAVRRLPPSERDVEVYRAIALEGVPTREAARSAGISQTRVRQIVSRVVRWIAETLPAALADELAPEVALKMAQAVAAQRLELMYSHAMTAWRNTAQPRYMGLAIRVTTAQARLPISPMLLDCVMADAIEPEREEPAPRSRTRQSAGQAGGAAARGLATSATVEALDENHPQEDCSPQPASLPAGNRSPTAASATSPSLPTASKPLTPEQSAARRALLAAARPLLSPSGEPENGPPLPDLDLGEDELLRRLSRRQRKLRRAK